jgi:hypothetical protein
MSGYTKLFSSILASTIWRADDQTRIVWITLLAMADRDGLIEASLPGVADFARVSLTDCARALAHLSSPDPYSRSPDADGRRIVATDGGWRLINHAKYRHRMSQDERREYLRTKQREYRQRKRVNTASTSVNNVSDKSTMLTHTEADTDTERDLRTVPDLSTESDRCTPTSTSTSSSSALGDIRSAPLIMSPLRYAQLRKSHAYVGSRLRVPAVLHDELRAKLGGATPETALMDWYATVDAEVEASGEAILEVFPWLRARFLAWAGAQVIQAELEKHRPKGA